MSQKNNSVKHIYNSRKNIIFYLKNLGFDVSNFEYFNIAEINAMDQNSTNDVCELDFEVFKNDTNEEIESCSVKYYIKGNIKQSVLEGFVNDFYMEKNENETSLEEENNFSSTNENFLDESNNVEEFTPKLFTEVNVVIQDKQGTITSSFFFIPADFKAK